MNVCIRTYTGGEWLSVCWFGTHYFWQRNKKGTVYILSAAILLSVYFGRTYGLFAYILLSSV